MWVKCPGVPESDCLIQISILSFGVCMTLGTLFNIFAGAVPQGTRRGYRK